MSEQSLEQKLLTKRVIETTATFYGNFVRKFGEGFDYNDRSNIDKALRDLNINKNNLKSHLRTLKESYNGRLATLLTRISSSEGKGFYLNYGTPKKIIPEESIIKAFFRIRSDEGGLERTSRRGEGGIWIPYNWIRKKLVHPFTSLGIMVGAVGLSAFIATPDPVNLPAASNPNDQGLANITAQELIRFSYDGIQDLIPLLSDYLNAATAQAYIIAAEALFATHVLYYVSGGTKKISEFYNRFRGRTESTTPTPEIDEDDDSSAGEESEIEKDEKIEYYRGLNVIYDSNVLNQAKILDKINLNLIKAKYHLPEEKTARSEETSTE